MNNLINLVRSWAERLTINVLSLFPKVKPSTIQTIKDKFNEKDQATAQTIRDLRSNKGTWNLANVIKWLIISIVGGIIVYIVFIVIKLIKKR